MNGWPSSIQVNAWAGDEDNRSGPDDAFKQTLLEARPPVPDTRHAPEPIDPTNWKDPRVGWGIVLPENDALSAGDSARALDAPEPLRKLLFERSGVVLRYRTDAPLNTIRRYYDDGRAAQDPTIGASFGNGPGQIPRYLAICAPPSAIPWEFQYRLQLSHFTGRIDLDEAGWGHYASALLDDWAGSTSDPERTLVWSVEHNPFDITNLMRRAIADPVHQKFEGDPQYAAKAVYIDGSRQSATAADLIAELQGLPILVTTTSHGQTGPLSSVPTMLSQLGCLVDSDMKPLMPDTLLADWQPNGAIWYAHACCSAGSVAATAYEGLVPAGSSVANILSGVAKCGNAIAPTPRALLGAAKPLRAFIGHIEPTFDWTVRQPKTNQFLTQSIIDLLYQSLFTGQPVGMALEGCRRMAGSMLLAAFAADRADAVAGNANASELLAIKLMAYDWRALVLIGDPTCRIA